MVGKVLYTHRDSLELLGQARPLDDKLEYIHDLLAQRYDFIKRVAVAVYDPKTDLLKTFIHSSGGAKPLVHYHAKLSETRSLQEIVASGKARVVNDLSIFENNNKKHSERIAAQGYRSSYTLPMFRNGEFFGFIFFNASLPNAFTREVLHDLDLFGHLLSLTVIGELQQLRTLEAAIHTAQELTNHRDAETGGHLDRMSRYARLIAETLAEKYDFSDEYIEKIFLFSPLHDIGKIAISDNILLKRGKLTEEEFEIMKTHTEKGREIIANMLEQFGVDKDLDGEMLTNIAHRHHERLDGKGYPGGLQGEDIPIEARIVAVADIFDALTSARPYKPAWDNEKAFAMLRELSGVALDPECVEALLSNVERIEQIQQQFRENIYG